MEKTPKLYEAISIFLSFHAKRTSVLTHLGAFLTASLNDAFLEKPEDFSRAQASFQALYDEMNEDDSNIRREDKLYICYFLGKLRCQNGQNAEGISLFDEALSLIAGNTPYQQAWAQRLTTAKTECYSSKSE